MDDRRVWRTWVVCAVAGLMTACGGGGGTSGSPPVSPPSPDVLAAIAQASAKPENDTALSASSSLSVVQSAGVPAVQVGSTPKVNFSVFSDRQIKTGLTVSNVSVIIAKLIPGSNGNPDEWQAYTHRTRAAATLGANSTATAAVKATLINPAYAQTTTAYTDPKQTDPALLATQLTYNAAGYYTYTFSTDIRNPSKTFGVKYEPGLTHRVAIQLSYTNAAGQTVKVNPYFDFTIDANGNSVAITDSAKTRKVTDVASCNGCHEKLALHGGGRVDTQYCVTCHNPGSVDANSGNSLNLATMVHKIHAGKLLKSQTAAGGEFYTIRNADFSEVGFPQDLRNCSVCHSEANPKTPQGGIWKVAPSKEACLTCHANKAGSRWEVSHTTLARMSMGPDAKAADFTNQRCLDCHKAGSAISAERVHWNQNEENAAKYRMNIESATYDASTRQVTVKYFLSDPTRGDAAYNLVTNDCTGVGTASFNCPNTSMFGNLRFYLAYGNMIGQAATTTEFSAYNNGGSGANAYAYKGSNDGNNHYTVSIAIPADSAVAQAGGTARVVSLGQIKEPKLMAIAATDPRPEVVPRSLINTIVQHSFTDVSLSGTTQPRRQIVSTEKCNVCHGALGTTSGSNTLADAFHSGARNTVEACAICHDANRASSTVMTNGLALNESYQFKRMIHGIHGNSKRTSPFTHGNTVVGAFNMDGTSKTGGAPLASNVENYAAEVLWPGVGINCNACHVNNSYQVDAGSLGAVVKKPTGVTNPNGWLVISPKASTCTACHDSAAAIAHVTNDGGASFGTRTQLEIASMPRETCDDCHAVGLAKGVDIVHGQR